MRRSACLVLAKACSMGLKSGRIGRQEDEVAACGLNEGPGAGALVHREIVQDHDLPGPQTRHQHPLHEGFEDEPIDCAPHQQALADAAGVSVASHDMASRRPRGIRPTARWPGRRSRSQPGQRRRRARLIEKDEPARIDPVMAARHAARAPSSRSCAIRLFF